MAIAGWILTSSYAAVCSIAISMFIDSRLNSGNYDGYYKESLNLIAPASAAVFGTFLIPTIIFSIVGAVKNKKTKKDSEKEMALKKYIIEPYDLGLRIQIGSLYPGPPESYIIHFYSMLIYPFYS